MKIENANIMILSGEYPLIMQKGDILRNCTIVLPSNQAGVVIADPDGWEITGCTFLHSDAEVKSEEPREVLYDIALEELAKLNG